MFFTTFKHYLDYATYVMRVGRTGRLKHGNAHSFFDPIANCEIVDDLVKVVIFVRFSFICFLGLGEPKHSCSGLCVKS